MNSYKKNRIPILFRFLTCLLIISFVSTQFLPFTQRVCHAQEPAINPTLHLPEPGTPVHLTDPQSPYNDGRG